MITCFEFEYQVYVIEKIRIFFPEPQVFPANSEGYFNKYTIPLGDDYTDSKLSERITSCIGVLTPFVIFRNGETVMYNICFNKGAVH